MLKKCFWSYPERGWPEKPPTTVDGAVDALIRYRNMKRRENNMKIFGALTVIAIAFGGVAAWITHIVTCITLLMAGGSAGVIVLFIIGLLCAPVGVVHGIMIWFGAGLG
jgi:hypothetical protein